jgi:hypothetical protein
MLLYRRKKKTHKDRKKQSLTNEEVSGSSKNKDLTKQERLTIC